MSHPLKPGDICYHKLGPKDEQYQLAYKDPDYNGCWQCLPLKPEALSEGLKREQHIDGTLSFLESYLVRVPPTFEAGKTYMHLSLGLVKLEEPDPKAQGGWWANACDPNMPTGRVYVSEGYLAPVGPKPAPAVISRRKYLVHREYTVYSTVEVEAESPRHAAILAKDMPMEFNCTLPDGSPDYGTPTHYDVECNYAPCGKDYESTHFDGGFFQINKEKKA